MPRHYVDRRRYDKYDRPSVSNIRARIAATDRAIYGDGSFREAVDPYTGQLLPQAVPEPVYHRRRAARSPPPLPPAEYYHDRDLEAAYAPVYAAFASDPDYDINFDRIEKWKDKAHVHVTWISPGHSPQAGSLNNFLYEVDKRAKSDEIARAKSGETEPTGPYLRVTFGLRGEVDLTDSKNQWLAHAIFMRLGNVIQHMRPRHMVVMVRWEAGCNERFQALFCREIEHWIASRCCRIGAREGLDIGVEFEPLVGSEAQLVQRLAY